MHRLLRALAESQKRGLSHAAQIAKVGDAAGEAHEQEAEAILLGVGHALNHSLVLEGGEEAGDGALGQAHGAAKLANAKLANIAVEGLEQQHGALDRLNATAWLLLV